MTGENALTRLNCMEFARSGFKKWAPGTRYKIHPKNANIL